MTTCPDCGHDLHAYPDAMLCPHCAAELPTRSVSAPTMRAIYQRASDLAAGGDVDAALAEVHYGLTEYNVPDLHLLAAILCQRAGRTDEMNAHVAAIPVDDALRAEAEWLLRSHSRGADATANNPATASDDELFSLDEIIGRPPQAPLTPEKGPSRWPPVLAAVALVALLIAWLAGGERWAEFGADRLTGIGAAAVEPDRGSSAAGVNRGEDATGLVTLPTPTPSAIPSATPLPTATVDPSLVIAPTAPAELAGVEESLALNAEARFDLYAYLRNDGYDELAELGVNAWLQDAELTLAGFVPYAGQRVELVELAESIAGVGEVNANELFFRPPVTYTVQAGDTLWSITFLVYGDESDVARMEAIFEANQDVLTSPSALAVGMEIKLPPLE